MLVVTTNQLAKALNLSTRRVNELIKLGILKRIGKNQYDLLESETLYDQYKNGPRRYKRDEEKKQIKKEAYERGRKAGVKEANININAKARKLAFEIIKRREEKQKHIKIHGRVCNKCGEHWPGYMYSGSNQMGCVFCRTKMPKVVSIYKICGICELEKIIYDFHKNGNRSSNANRKTNCKACESERRIKQRKQKAKMRRKKPEVRLHKRMSEMIRRSIKKGKQGESWVNFVDYTLADLRDHIERLFTEGMTWEKLLAGDIHIDHIIPQSMFSFESPHDADFKRCWALSNLQPLWSKENSSKGNTKIYRKIDGAQGFEVLL